MEDLDRPVCGKARRLPLFKRNLLRLPALRPNGMTKLTKEKDLEYKTNEAASLDKAVSELTTFSSHALTAYRISGAFWALIAIDLEGVNDERRRCQKVDSSRPG